jgi:cobalt-zinc-cadmium efflux system protein
METHRHSHAKSALKPALAITAAFLVAEFVGALYTNSLALLADSGHMLTDVAALSLSLAASWFTTRRATPPEDLRISSRRDSRRPCSMASSWS